MFLSFIHKEDYCDESAQSASQASESYDLYGQNARARIEVLSHPEKTKRIVTQGDQIGRFIAVWATF